MKIDRLLVLGWLLLCTPFLTGCAQSRLKEKEKVKMTAFPMPKLPPMLSNNPAVRAEYMANHYWESYPFADTSLIANKAVTEQGFANFIDVLRYVKPEVAQKALTGMMMRAQVDSAMYRHFVQLSEFYLHDPNSPYRNDELYIPVLDQIIGSTLLSDLEKIRPIYVREMVQKNRVGTKATDFEYIMPNGKKGKLYDIHANYTLLFFNNPDCHQCGEYKKYIASSSNFKQWQTPSKESTRLKIIAMYPDKDVELWKKTDYPKGWINGHNPTMADGQLYDVRAIPSFYLLNGDKTVLMKDVLMEQVESYLYQMLEMPQKPFATE